MVLLSTCIMLLLATVRMNVCAPTEGTFESAKVSIISDDGLKNQPIWKEESASSTAGDGVLTGSNSCKGDSCSHIDSKIQESVLDVHPQAPDATKSTKLKFDPKEVCDKLLELQIDSGSTEDEISTNTDSVTENQAIVPATKKIIPEPRAPPPSPLGPISKPGILLPHEIYHLDSIDEGSDVTQGGSYTNKLSDKQV
ncbi:hypothetical protein DFH28DRAFT_956629 [Melampsora americana]|nr:hypothetical protein DFH28DRAFT_956629 [Melampsora americana]